MKVSANGIQLNYQASGDAHGPVVVMSHSLAATHAMWDPQMDVLKDYRIIRYDMRGHGESDAPAMDYSLEMLADDLFGLMDALEINQAHYIGLSMGGMIGQIVAYDFPQRTQSLVSIMSTTWAPHLPQPGRAQQDGISEMNESSEEQAADLQKLGFYPSALPNQVTAILSAGDRTARVAQISAPTLVLHGADDQLLTVEHGEHTAQTIKDAQFKVYENMGHNLPDPIIPQMVNDMLAHLRANPI